MFFDESLSSSPSADCVKLKKGYGCVVESNPDNLQYHNQIYNHYHVDGRTYASDTTYDRERKKGFYLEDVANEHNKGSRDPSGRTTYYQIYGTAGGGYVIQYWFFYAFNDANALFGLGKHGGDWEQIHVVLNSAGNPVRVRFFGHDGNNGIVEKVWAEVAKEEGTHPKMYVQKGDHPSLPSGPENGTKHKTWEAGNFVNLGSKLRPNTGMYFLRYSGMWGTPGDSYPILGKINSGYWAPSYNETGKSNSDDPFFPAWCADRPAGSAFGQKDEQILYEDGSTIKECYAPVPGG